MQSGKDNNDAIIVITNTSNVDSKFKSKENEKIPGWKDSIFEIWEA